MMGLACLGYVALSPNASRAAKDPDWPCVQPYVGALTAATYWGAAPAPTDAEWRGNAKIADLVAAVSPRDVPVADAKSQLSAFADAVPAAERGVIFAQILQGVVDDTNEERGRIVARIKDLARRQRELSGIATQLAAQLHDAPPDTPAAEELTQRRDFATRAFQEAQRTMRYACEVPPAMDAKVGQLAQVLHGLLGN